MSTPAIIYAAPIAGLAEQLRAEADTLERLGITDLAGTLRETAGRIDVAIEAARDVAHLTTHDLARLRGTTPDAVAAVCRRRWHRQGRARKVAGEWRIDPGVVQEYAA
jgi:hypothetical protein